MNTEYSAAGESCFGFCIILMAFTTLILSCIYLSILPLTLTGVSTKSSLVKNLLIITEGIQKLPHPEQK